MSPRGRLVHLAGRAAFDMQGTLETCRGQG